MVWLEMRNKCVSHNVAIIGLTICFFMLKNFLSKRLWPLIWPHQGAILENNVPFQISNGPQLWLVKLRASICIDKYHFLNLYGLCNGFSDVGVSIWTDIFFTTCVLCFFHLCFWLVCSWNKVYIQQNLKSQPNIKRLSCSWQVNKLKMYPKKKKVR
jgi:hypothetical protein